MSQPRITWLASYPKSGNTWVRKFLEAYLFRHTSLNGGPIRKDLSPELAQSVSMRPITEMTPEELIVSRPAALQNQLFALAKDGGDVIMKTHHANAGPYFIPPQLSKAAIYVVRDPRDVALSFARHMGVSIDKAAQTMLHDGAQIGREALKYLLMSWATHVQSWTVGTLFPVVIVRYEDLHADPVSEFGELLTALGIPVVDSQLQWAVDECSFESLQAKEDSEGLDEAFHGDRFFHSGKVGRWKWETKLQPYLPQMEQAFAEQMERFGYLSKVVVG